jgi:N-acetylglucosamine-6-phosphate deacetylase
MRTIIRDGKIITPETILEGKTLVLEGQKVKAIESDRVNPLDEDLVIDARRFWITPGLIDIHVHGAVGYDASDATPEAVSQMGRFMVRHGVTSYLPTTISAQKEAISAAIENVANCAQPSDGSHHLGVHIEGPYFNPAHRGAQTERHLRDADPCEYEEWLCSGVVKLVSVAPERQGVLELIRRGASMGIEFAAGHTGATYEQVIQAADQGLRQATHTFNGMLGIHHRRPGTVGAVLTDDRIYAQIIADGIHVHPAMANLLVRAKGVSRTILITDAIRAAGLEDGRYMLGDDWIVVKNGISRTTEGGLAGSTLTMDTAIRNMISFTGLSFQEILPMATSVPARAMGWYGRKGSIAPGADADITIFDRQLQIWMTIVSGTVVYPVK